MSAVPDDHLQQLHPLLAAATPAAAGAALAGLDGHQLKTVLRGIPGPPEPVVNWVVQHGRPAQRYLLARRPDLPPAVLRALVDAESPGIDPTVLRNRRATPALRLAAAERMGVSDPVPDTPPPQADPLRTRTRRGSRRLVNHLTGGGRHAPDWPSLLAEARRAGLSEQLVLQLLDLEDCPPTAVPALSLGALRDGSGITDSALRRAVALGTADPELLLRLGAPAGRLLTLIQRLPEDPRTPGQRMPVNHRQPGSPPRLADPRTPTESALARQLVDRVAALLRDSCGDDPARWHSVIRRARNGYPGTLPELLAESPVSIPATGTVLREGRLEPVDPNFWLLACHPEPPTGTDPGSRIIARIGREFHVHDDPRRLRLEIVRTADHDRAHGLLHVDDPELLELLSSEARFSCVRRSAIASFHQVPERVRANLGRTFQAPAQAEAGVVSNEPELIAASMRGHLNPFVAGRETYPFTLLRGCLRLAELGRLDLVHTMAATTRSKPTPHRLRQFAAVASGPDGTAELRRRLDKAEARFRGAGLYEWLRGQRWFGIDRRFLHTPHSVDWEALLTKHRSGPLAPSDAARLLQRPDLPEPALEALFTAEAATLLAGIPAPTTTPAATRRILAGAPQEPPVFLLAALSDGRITPAELVELARPARSALHALSGCPERAPDPHLRELIAGTLTTPAAWQVAAGLLPTFNGTLAELLATASAVSRSGN